MLFLRFIHKQYITRIFFPHAYGLAGSKKVRAKVHTAEELSHRTRRCMIRTMPHLNDTRSGGGSVPV